MDRSAQHAGRGLRHFPELQPRRRRGGGPAARPVSTRTPASRPSSTATPSPAASPGSRSWRAALASCRALVVLLGPAGIGGWQHREIQLGLDRQAAAEKTATPFPVIPVLLPGLQPDDVPLGTFLALNTWVDLRPGLDEPEALQRLIAAAQGQRDRRPHPRPRWRLRPYRGLLPFREQDAGLFFGRERFVDELVAKVRQRSATNLVAVLGRSGSGKSSVVFAGLFPALRQEKGAGQQAVWQILDLRPGAEPLHALIETFDPPDASLTRTAEAGRCSTPTRTLLRKGEVTLAQLVRDRLKDDPGTTRLLLYVDQWEELYTQAQPREVKSEEDKARAADARLFVDLVLDAAAKAPCTLVLSVRSDFYPDIQTHDAPARRRPGVPGQPRADDRGRADRRDRGPGQGRRRQRRSRADQAAPARHRPRSSGGRDDQYDIGKLPLLEYALEQAWAKAEDGRDRPRPVCRPRAGARGAREPDLRPALAGAAGGRQAPVRQPRHSRRGARGHAGADHAAGRSDHAGGGRGLRRARAPA